MGLFSWLFGKPARVAVRDLVWRSGEERAREAKRAVGTHLAGGRPVLVLAHFPATLAAFGEHVARTGWPNTAVPPGLTPAAALELAAGTPRVLFGLTRDLRPGEPPPPESAPESPLPVLVLERHFLRRRDDRVVRFAEGLGGRASVDFLVALDDPLLKLFAGEWLASVLTRMGIKDGERIESPMVARRIGKAQARFSAEIATEYEADSAGEWLERNRPS